MSLIDRCVQGYRILTHFYPTWFRLQFGEEMRSVFEQISAEAASQGNWRLLAAFWREVRDLPAAILKQQLYGRQMEMRAMNEPVRSGTDILSVKSNPVVKYIKPSVWEIFAALLPLLAWGAAWIYAARVDIFPDSTRFGQSVQWDLAAHLITLVGLGVGWRLNFPKWSYLYAGLALTFSAYWTGLAMNGWRILGYEFLEEGARWAWRAWVPFLVMVVVMLGVTRSLKPVKQFFGEIWADWSRLSLALYGWLSFLFITVVLDSIELPIEMWQPVVMVAAYLVGVVLFMLAGQPWRSALGLDLGLFAGVGGAIVLGRLTNPNASQWVRLADVPPEGRAMAVLLWLGWIVFGLGLVFLPLILRLFRKTKQAAPAA